MSWRAQNRSKDAKTPNAGLAMPKKLELASCQIQPYLYICHTAMFIFNFITAQTYLGHNFGPDALARKQCRACMLVALGRALGVGPHGPAPPHPSDHAKSERTRSVLVLVLAAVGTLQFWRSRRDGSASKCAGSARKRTYRCHLWLLSPIIAQKPPMLCPNGHQPFGTKAQHATLLMHLTPLLLRFFWGVPGGGRGVCGGVRSANQLKVTR
jgi:hypothetical protein